MLPGTDAFAAFVTTSTIEDSVVNTLANSGTTPAPCRNALALYERAWNDADRTIEPLHSAEQAHDFAAVGRAATARAIEHLETLLARGRRAVQGAC